MNQLRTPLRRSRSFPAPRLRAASLERSQYAATQSRRRSSYCGVLFVALSALYVFASVRDIVSFSIWPSVEEFLGQLDPYLYFQKTWEEILLSPWGVRTGVAMPALLLAEMTSLTQPEAFGLQCGLLLVATALIINRTAVDGFNTVLFRHELAVTGFIFSLGYFMNGRLCSAFVGSAILMRAHLLWIQNKYTTNRVLLYNFIALPLLSVSSGTFMVGFMTVVTWIIFALFDLRQRNETFRFRPSILFGSTPILFLALVQSQQFTLKLYDYYEGDMVQVLYHGYGQFLESQLQGLTMMGLILVIILSAPTIAFALRALARGKSWAQIYLYYVIVMTVVAGSCGYSTLFTNTPSAVLCAVLWYYRRFPPVSCRT